MESEGYENCGCCEINDYVEDDESVETEATWCLNCGHSPEEHGN